MPFDPAPIQTPAKVGKYQEFADAMLRGCAVTKPCRGGLAHGNDQTCALGAILVGWGWNPAEIVRHIHTPNTDSIWGFRAHLIDELSMDYAAAYGLPPAMENDCGLFTREQIAARIAAL